jgi:hypothetical protein
MPSISVAEIDKARLDKLRKRPDGVRTAESYASVVHRVLDEREKANPA